MHIIVISLGIKDAPIEVLERVSVHHSQNMSCVQNLKNAANLHGAVVLSTCNRLEFYGVCDDVQAGVAAMKLAMMGEIPSPSGRTDCADRLHGLIKVHADADAVRHLYTVVSGLDSLIVGECEIAGQVARAYEAACKAGTTDKIINVLFQRALQLGKKVRTQTNIMRYSTSVGRIAVDIAVRNLGDIKDKRVLILGAGDVSELTMKCLTEKHASVVMVSNRSLDKARQLADQYGFEAHPIDDVRACLSVVDVVFSATAAKTYLIGFDDVRSAMAKRPETPLLCIDMAVPRDIDPEVRRIPNVAYYDINELHNVADQHQRQRDAAVETARQMIDRAVADFCQWQSSLDCVSTIEALYRKSEQIKADKLEKAMHKLNGLTPDQLKAVQCLASSITHQLMHDPVTSLNAMAGTSRGGEYVLFVRDLFQLDGFDAPAVRAEDAAAFERQEALA